MSYRPIPTPQPPSPELEPPSKDVFLLGAGFSAAIDDSMPTLNRLGKLLTAELLGSDRHKAMLPAETIALLQEDHIPGGNVEAWLSTLAEPQPFMTDAEASYAYGLYSELADLVVEIISGSEAAISSTPPWLAHLVRIWHRDRITVATFNYDTLIERTAQAKDMPGSHGNLRWATRLALPLPPPLASAQPIDRESLLLLKLHGSTDLFWTPGDRTGETISDAFGDSDAYMSRFRLAGKRAFVIPPLSAKSSFYSLGFVRSQWQNAAAALRTAERVIVIGYSCPVTDLSVGALLASVAKRDIPWDVVDIDQSVVSRLTHLGIDKNRIRWTRNVEEFVARYQTERNQALSALVSEQLRTRGIDDTAPIMSMRTRSAWDIVTSVADAGDRILLRSKINTPQEPIPVEYVREREFADLIASRPGMPIVVVRDGADEELPVLGLMPRQAARGSGAILSWCILETQDFDATQSVPA